MHNNNHAISWCTLCLYYIIGRQATPRESHRRNRVSTQNRRFINLGRNRRNTFYGLPTARLPNVHYYVSKEQRRYL